MGPRSTRTGVGAAAALLSRWSALRGFRGEVQKQLEALREAGRIGSSLQAEVVVTASGEKHAMLAALGDDLRFVLIPSKTELRQSPPTAEPVIPDMPRARLPLRRR